MNIQRTVFAAAMTALLLAAPAYAIDKCKVKVSKKTGVIEVTAVGVGGALLWGTELGSETTPVDNAGTCVSGTTAKKCNLADPVTVAAKPPPERRLSLRNARLRSRHDRLHERALSGQR